MQNLLQTTSFMNRQELFEVIKKRQSFLCIGLDTDIEKVPKHLLDQPDPVFAFNRAVIDATAAYCVAYKPNTAFYEAHGAAGWASLKKTIDYIPSSHLAIADAKRGDIGNTSKMYAKAFFELMQADAITIAPYMGADSVLPFLEAAHKWVILLALTSNQGSEDFQLQRNKDQTPLFESVMRKAMQWGTVDNLMFVVGATQADKLAQVRKIAPDHFLLVPGVGAQGGSLAEVAQHGLNRTGGLLVNASRSIIYASNGHDFAEAAAAEAQKLQQEMSNLLDQYLPN